MRKRHRAFPSPSSSAWPKIKGQALVETAGAILILCGIVWVGVRFLKLEWNRLECAHQIFEATLREALGESRPRNSIYVHELPDGFEGALPCGEGHERFYFRKLE